MKKILKFKKQIIILVLVIIAIFAGLKFIPKKDNNSFTEAQDEFKRTVMLQKGELYSSVNIKGTVTSAEVSTVSTSISSKVTKLFVKVGDIVKKGDMIAELDATEINRQIKEKQELIAADKKANQETIDRLQKNYNDALNTKKTLVAAKDANINSLNSLVNDKKKETTDYESKLNSAKSNYELMMTKVKPLLDNVTTLESNKQKAYESWIITNGNTSSAEYTLYTDATKALEDAIKMAEDAKILYSYDDYYKEYESVKSEYNKLNEELLAAIKNLNDVNSEKSSLIKEQDELISNINENLTSAKKKTNDSTANKELKDLQEQLKNTVLKAETSGKVTAISVTVGSVVKDNVATIQSTDKLLVSAKVQDYDISKLKQGQKVRVTSDASTNEVMGELTRISPTASQDADGGFEIDITLPKNDYLYIGTKARGEIILTSKENVYTVPIEAVEETENGNFIYIKNANGTFTQTAITTKDRNEFYVEIEGNFKDNDEVLANYAWNDLHVQSQEELKNNEGF